MHGQPPRWQFAALGLLVAAGFLLPLWIADYFLFIGNVLLTYAVLAIGLDILLGWSGQFAFAHVAFYGIGIYGTSLLHMRFGIPFVVGMPLTVVFAALVSLFIAFPATRLRTVYLALATYAFAEFAQWVFRSWDAVTGGPDGLQMSPAVVFGIAMDNDRQAMPVVAILAALMIGATLYLARSRLGRSLFAIRDSEHVAAASGIDVRKTKVIAFVLSAVYAAVAGGMYTLYQSYVHPDGLGVWTLVLVLTMIVVGGSGSIAGVLLGVVTIGLLPEFLRAAPKGLLVWQEFAYGLILILVIMYMPRGIRGLFRDTRGRRVRPTTAALPTNPPQPHGAVR